MLENSADTRQEIIRLFQQYESSKEILLKNKILSYSKMREIGMKNLYILRYILQNYKGALCLKDTEINIEYLANFVIRNKIFNLILEKILQNANAAKTFVEIKTLDEFESLILSKKYKYVFYHMIQNIEGMVYCMENFFEYESLKELGAKNYYSLKGLLQNSRKIEDFKQVSISPQVLYNFAINLTFRIETMESFNTFMKYSSNSIA